MVNIPLRTKKPFLRVQDAQDDDLATIVEPPYIASAEESRFGKEQTILTIKLERDNKTYRLTLNPTSNDRLVKAFGSDGDLWAGKQILLEKRTLTIGGGEKTVLFTTLVEAQEDLA